MQSSDYGAQENSKILKIDQKCHKVPLCMPYLISETDVFGRLCRLNRFKSCGRDEISNAVLRSMAGRVAELQAKIFNASLPSGQFPSTWKVCAIIPIPKGRGDRADVSSYRLISLTSSVSKVLNLLFTNSC